MDTIGNNDSSIIYNKCSTCRSNPAEYWGVCYQCFLKLCVFCSSPGQYYVGTRFHSRGKLCLGKSVCRQHYLEICPDKDNCINLKWEFLTCLMCNLHILEHNHTIPQVCYQCLPSFIIYTYTDLYFHSIPKDIKNIIVNYVYN